MLRWSSDCERNNENKGNSLVVKQDWPEQIDALFAQVQRE